MLPRYKYTITKPPAGSALPSAAELWLGQGLRLHQRGDLAGAKAQYNALRQAQPDHPEAMHLLGVVACQQEDYSQAVELIGRAVGLQPDNAAFLLNYGNALHGAGQHGEAVESFSRSLALRPGVAEAHFNRGNAQRALRRLKLAFADYEQAVSLDPSLVEAWWSAAFTLLLAGDYERGLPLYEWRTRRAGYRLLNTARPQWIGREPLEGKCILLHAEQGLGDTIQFCRYIPLVAQRMAKVILQLPEELAPLLRDIEGVDQLVVRGQPLPEFDCHTPLLSLPLALGTRLDSIPPVSGRIASTPEARVLWEGRLGAAMKTRIGVVWSSTSGFEDDHNRSVALADFVRALPQGSFDYICLQKDLKDSDKAALAMRGDIRFFGDQIRNFGDTAALVDSVDLVVSTCTAVPHLSATMGKPTWLLLAHAPDWRWQLEGTTTPWYPAARLYRQPTIGDWASVFATVHADLKALSTRI